MPSGILNELNDLNIFWDAVNFERTQEHCRVREDIHYQKDPEISILYIKLKEVYPFYMEYCNRNRIRSVDYNTLLKLFTSGSYQPFLPNTTSRGGKAYTRKGFSSCYRFRYTEHYNEKCMIISDKDVYL